MIPLFDLTPKQIELSEKYQEIHGEDSWINASKALGPIDEDHFWGLVAESINEGRPIVLEWDPYSDDLILGAKLA